MLLVAVSCASLARARAPCSLRVCTTPEPGFNEFTPAAPHRVFFDVVMSVHANHTPWSNRSDVLDKSEIGGSRVPVLRVARDGAPGGIPLSPSPSLARG